MDPYNLLNWIGFPFLILSLIIFIASKNIYFGKESFELLNFLSHLIFMQINILYIFFGEILYSDLIFSILAVLILGQKLYIAWVESTPRFIEISRTIKLTSVIIYIFSIVLFVCFLTKYIEYNKRFENGFEAYMFLDLLLVIVSSQNMYSVIIFIIYGGKELYKNNLTKLKYFFELIGGIFWVISIFLIGSSDNYYFTLKKIGKTSLGFSMIIFNVLQFRRTKGYIYDLYSSFQYY